MKIEIRDPTLKYSQAIKHEKIRLILDWLLEFRFSSVELLSRRIGSIATNSNRFFNLLLEHRVIQSFKNIYSTNERYVMLTSMGVSYLEAQGRDVAKAVTRVAKLGRYAQMLHDMAVQYAVLSRLERFDEVIWDRHIQLPEQLEKPDALLHSPRGYWAALEYERWRKSNQRIYIFFMNHVRALDAGHYKCVFLLFDQQADLNHYQQLFDEKQWPLYKRNSKSGQISALNDHFIPDEVKDLRRCFVFMHEAIE